MDAKFFETVWPMGFLTTGKAGEDGARQIVKDMIEPYADKNGVALEIGSGGGYYTRELAERFKRVYAVDVVPKLPNYIANLKGFNNVKYIRVPSNNYYLWPIKDNSIDLCFSFDVFNHLPLSGILMYLINVKRVLKEKGHAIISIGFYSDGFPVPKRKFKYYWENPNENACYCTPQDKLKEYLDIAGIRVANEFVKQVPPFRMIHIVKGLPMLESIPKNFMLDLMANPNAKKFLDAGGDEGLRFSYPLNEKSVVFDLGGFEGTWAKGIYDRYRPNIYVFEPLRESVEKSMAAFAGIDRVHHYNWAISDKNYHTQMSAHQSWSSLYFGEGFEREVRVRDIADVIKELGVTDIDLMKLNIEGAEYTVMNRLLDTGLVKNVRYFQIQYHELSPECAALRDDIRRRLAETHKIMWEYPFVWESWERK